MYLVTFKPESGRDQQTVDAVTVHDLGEWTEFRNEVTDLVLRVRTDDVERIERAA